jgi:hypothetical protein
MASDIRLAEVKVSVTAVTFIDLMSFHHSIMHAVFVKMKLMEELLEREPHSV